MPTIPQTLHGAEDSSIPPVELQYLIGRSLLKSLGTPAELLKVRVHPVGNDRYRVNVLVGKSAGVAKIAHSFFLTADAQGNIKESTPKITRQY